MACNESKIIYCTSGMIFCSLQNNHDESRIYIHCSPSAESSGSL